MKRALPLLIAFALVGAMAGCGGARVAAQGTTSASSSTTAIESQASTTPTVSDALSVTYDEEDLDATWDPSTATSITLADGSTKVLGAGATANGSTVTITAGGTYVVTGELDDGQIVVDSNDKETVRLVLNGADMSCPTSAPIYVKSANKTILTLADGTENSVTDGESYEFEDAETDEPNAAVFSTCDLTINGSGSLTVTANYNNGIASKDDLKITGGDITVDAANDGIRGRDCIGVKDGAITITAGGDGMQSNNDENPKKGYIAIDGGTFDITAAADGIQAETTLLINNGTFTLSTGGGSANSSQEIGQPGNDWGDWGQGASAQGGTDSADTSTDTPSAKGLKAGVIVSIEGGTMAVDSSDDSIHSNDSVRIDGGSITLASGDDGVHADATLDISGGELTVSKSYEGLESAVMTIDDGTIHIESTDDAINVAGGADQSSVDGRPGQNAFSVNENNKLYINGGYIAVDAASGDGIDCNGRILMTDGTVIVNGPTNDGNGALDYLGEFTVSGGYIVAVGSSGMAEAPSDTSSQCSIMVNFDQVQQAGTLVHVQGDDGEDILTIAPTRQFQSVVLCSSVIKEGETYTVYLGGSSTGTVADTLYSGGTYTPGTESVSLTIAGIVTTSGTAGGTGGGGMPGGQGRRRAGGQGGMPGAIPGGTDPGTMPGGSSGELPGGTLPDGTPGNNPGSTTTTLGGV